MLVPLTVLSLSLLWILLISILARTQFPNRFRTRPRFGLALWFAALTSSVLASISALLGLGAAYMYFANSVALVNFGDSNWLTAFALSFVPWIVLGVFGVLLAIVNLRIEPPYVMGKKIQQNLQLAKQFFRNFEGVKVSSVSAPIHYALATKDEILISQYSLDQLKEDELMAVLWHELGHIRGRHQTLKTIAGVVATLTRPMSISRVFNGSVEELCEAAADNFAKRHCASETVLKVRKLMRVSD